MKRWDWAIVGVVLLAGLALLLLPRLGGGNRHALYVDIYIEGTLTQTIPCPAQGIITIPVKGRVGHNVIEVMPDGVMMREADCSGQDCVRMGKITRPGQVIACLPNKVLVALKGDAAARPEVDIIA